jgi:Fe2+ or Zn2+ uptake regulation protein
MEQKDIREGLVKGLKKKGFKLTPQRLQIIDIFSTEKGHPGARAIFVKARKRVPTISMSTVYYTLNLLKEEGLIRELEFDNMGNRYERNVSDHLNLICVECGRIQDFDGEFPVSLKRLEEKTGFRADKMRLEYYGHCKECNLKKVK